MTVFKRLKVAGRLWIEILLNRLTFLSISIKVGSVKNTRTVTIEEDEERTIIENAIPIRMFQDNQDELEKIQRRTHISMTALTRMAVDLGLPLLRQKLQANGK